MVLLTAFLDFTENMTLRYVVIAVLVVIVEDYLQFSQKEHNNIYNKII